MPQVSNEALLAFDEGFKACMRKIGGGKVGLDSTCVRELVRRSRDAAHRFVELHCVMASSQPGYLQTAIVVATAYQVEFEDPSLTRMVMERVNELDAHTDVGSIRSAKNWEALAEEPPERAAAKAWWRSNDRVDGRCDNCNRPIRRGEGYQISGRAVLMGESRIDLGEEIVCEACFHEIRSGEGRPR